MKKLLALLLAAVMCFSLVACGGDNGAKDSGKKTTIEITADNWQEYFELRTYNKFEKDALDEISYVTVNVALVSKDGIVPDWQASTVAAEYTFSREYRVGKLDVDSQTISYGDVTRTEQAEPLVTKFTTVGQYIGEITTDRYGIYLGNQLSGNIREEYTEASVIEDFSFVRIEGTFVFSQSE